MDGKGEARAMAAAQAAGLSVASSIWVAPRPDSEPTYVVLDAGFAPSSPEKRIISMRGKTGNAWSTEYIELRMRLGFT